MPRPFHKPVRRPNAVLDGLVGSGDPAELTQIAHASAEAVVKRGRENADPATLERLISYTDQHGVDDLAELWASAGAVSLPGALWRLYLLRLTVVKNLDNASYLFGRGIDADEGANQVVIGATHPPTPSELVALINDIMRGAFSGDFAVALERASAFCRVMARGLAETNSGGERSSCLVEDDERIKNYLALADEMSWSAVRWRDGCLD